MLLDGPFFFIWHIGCDLPGNSGEHPLPAAKAKQDKHPDGECDDDSRADQTNVPGDALNSRKIIVEEAARDKSQCSIDGGPYDAPGGIVNQKFAPGHMIDAGQERGPGAQNCYEATKKTVLSPCFSKNLSA